VLSAHGLDLRFVDAGGAEEFLRICALRPESVYGGEQIRESSEEGPTLFLSLNQLDAFVH
jgi:hypothetical protein